MPIEPTQKIWHNGVFIPWESATIHVMSHVVHYGSSVFEGIRVYNVDGKAGVFRLREHMLRFVNSAKMYRMPLNYTVDELCQAVLDTIKVNQVIPCYVRPVAFRGYGHIGVGPTPAPVEVYIVVFPWGPYLPGQGGVDACVSSWTRIAPNTMPTMAKVAGNYLNSQLIRMEAEANGYVEGIGLDVNGHISEGSGENIFLVLDNRLYTPAMFSSVLNGITRDSVIQLAKEAGYDVMEQTLPREMLYICDEAFFTGTATEVKHISSIDRIPVGSGEIGPVTKSIADEMRAILQGMKPDRFRWLTFLS